MLYYKSLNWPRQKETSFPPMTSDNYLPIFRWKPVLIRCTHSSNLQLKHLGMLAGTYLPHPVLATSQENAISSVQWLLRYVLCLLTSLYPKIFSILGIHFHSHNLVLKVNQVFLTSDIRNCESKSAAPFSDNRYLCESPTHLYIFLASWQKF